MSWRQEESPQAILTEHLVRSAVGCFLYLKLTLDLLERGSLVIKSSSFNVIPHSLSEIFLLNLNLVFSSEVAFTQTKTVFSICLAALKPMSLEQVYSCTRALEQESEAEGQTTWANFNQAYKTTMSQFLPLDSSTNKVSFFHPTFRDWLNGRRSTESNKFVCDPRIGHSAIALYLARNPRSLNEIQTLDLAHHVLKAQIFKSQTQSVSIKELQATWVSLASDNVSKALCCSKNLSSPNYVISKLLLLAGASPESSIRISSDNLFERPLLCHFAESGNEDMTSLLLEFGADVCCSDSEGVTPLMIAARANHAKLVDFLLTKGSVVNQCCTKGWTALTFASMNNSVEALEKLLSTTTRSWPNSGCNRDQAIQEALVAASTVQALQLLLQEGDVNRKSPISDEFPLERAINLGKREICEFLLQNGAKLDILSSPLHVAVMKGHWSIVDLLLKSRPGAIGEKDKLGRPALVVASSQGQISIMELLILKGASVNETDSEGITPLSWACIKNQESCVQFLLKHNDLNVHKEDNRGRTCLHHAAMTGNDQILTDILDKTDANIETCDENGIRPIDQAISYGNKLCVQTFLRKGAKLGPTTWAMAKGKQIIL